MKKIFEYLNESQKMQKNIDNEVHLGNSVTYFESMGKKFCN